MKSVILGGLILTRMTNSGSIPLQMAHPEALNVMFNESDL